MNSSMIREDLSQINKQEITKGLRHPILRALMENWILGRKLTKDLFLGIVRKEGIKV